MGIFTYLKIGITLALVSGIAWFVWDWRDSKHAAELLQMQNQAQQETIQYYEKAQGVDQKTREINDDIKDAVKSGDRSRIRTLIERLRQHQRGDAQGEAGPPADARSHQR
jgi:hypothetical protein